MRIGPYDLVNIDRLHCLPGEPSEYDHCMVYDTRQTEVHPITNEPQRKLVFSGTVTECHAWIKDQQS